MHKIQLLKNKVISWSWRKRILYGLLLLLVIFIIFNILKPENNSDKISTDLAKVIDLKQTVLATGQVTSNTDLDLSFSKSGVVKSIRVKVGDKVTQGQVLATLDQGNELASLTSAKGAVAGAEAKYKKILEGASNEEIDLAKIALENAKRDYSRIKSQQEILVKNAYLNLLNSTLEAVPTNGNNENDPPVISGNYQGDKVGEITITIYNTGSGVNFDSSGLVQGTGMVTSTTPQAIANSGLYIKFPTGSTSGTTEWIISIPNKKASDYVTNNNAYEAALKTQESALGTAQALIDQRQAELSIKQSVARPSDIDLAKADILSAQGQLQLANSNLESTIIRAPSNGTITDIDIKIGELAQASKSAIILQDIDSLYLEANINEANIVSIQRNALIEINFDALGTERLFTGRILNIDPASNVISGVVNYKVTAEVIDPPKLLPGMTANMTILVGSKKNALVIPARSILKDKSGKRIVRLITNTKTKEHEEKQVSIGLEGDGGLTEITNGLAEGDEVVVLIKK